MQFGSSRVPRKKEPNIKMKIKYIPTEFAKILLNRVSDLPRLLRISIPAKGFYELAEEVEEGSAMPINNDDSTRPSIDTFIRVHWWESHARACVRCVRLIERAHAQRSCLKSFNYLCHGDVSPRWSRRSSRARRSTMLNDGKLIYVMHRGTWGERCGQNVT